MRFIASQADDDSGDLLKAPAMVDVVFILLSFFVLATHLLAPERDFAMGHREAGAAGGAVRDDFPPFIPVTLRRAGPGVAISVGQARLGVDDYAALRAKLHDINLPDLPVLVLAEESLTVDQMARALDAALGSPMKRVSVARLATAGAEAGP